MKEEYVINSLKHDMGLDNNTPMIYRDKNHILEYNNENGLDVKASLKRYTDIVYNLELNPKNFRFQGIKDYKLYDIYIDNDSFTINISKDNHNKPNTIKTIQFYKTANKSYFTIMNKTIDCTINDYVSVERDYDRNRMVTLDMIYETRNKISDIKINRVTKELVDTEENEIREAFDIINHYIANFFNSIKHDYNSLASFNELYNNDNINEIVRDVFRIKKR